MVPRAATHVTRLANAAWCGSSGEHSTVCVSQTQSAFCRCMQDRGASSDRTRPLLKREAFIFTDVSPSQVRPKSFTHLSSLASQNSGSPHPDPPGRPVSTGRTGATGTGSQVPTAKVPLPRNAFGTPEGCGGAADVCIPSARRVLCCARSSAARPV